MFIEVSNRKDKQRAIHAAASKRMQLEPCINSASRHVFDTLLTLLLSTSL